MNAPVSSQDSASNPAQRPLLGLLTAVLYGLFTLLPDSSTLMLSWAWVLIWQVTLLCPVFWLMIQAATDGWRSLGQALDLIAIGVVVAIVQSGVTSAFPQQARWAGIAALCALGALYACNHYFRDAQSRTRVLTLQGLLQVAFILLSLGLWGFQTWLPELDRLRALQQETGLVMPFSFEAVESRNWAPIGHQNYVAGYLTLAIPSLVGLSWSRSGRLRWIFAIGAGLGVVALYTTASRAGLIGVILALVGATLTLITQSKSLQIRLSKSQLMGGSAVGVSGIVAALLGTGRLDGILKTTFSGQVSGEFAYRLITNSVGWAMGLQSPLYGLGIGSVPHFFQKFRPFWAGREVELAFQLHSTPAQLFGELGLLGLGLFVGTIAWLARLWWRSRHRLSAMTHSLFAAILAYSIQSLSDYQLDNLCITGTLVIFLAAIVSDLNDLDPESQGASQDLGVQMSAKLSRLIVPAIGGLTIAALLWLIPVHRAWMLSNQGFQSLATVENNDISPEQRQAAIVQFTQNLEEAHRLAPWEPYYPQQLGWVLGDLGIKSNRTDFLEQSIRWLNIARDSSPHQEFVYSSLGWLQLNTDPKAASGAFRRAADLVPAKRGVFYGLGMSLLFQNRMDVAIEALALEVVRDPIALTSPWWQTSQRQPLFQQVIQRVESIYTELINQASNASLVTHLQGCRSTLRWWTGNFEGAQVDATASQFHAMNAVLALHNNQPVDLSVLATKPYVSPSTIATLTAWMDPSQRQVQLQKAWILGVKQPIPSGMVDRLQGSMAQSKSFNQWLKQKSPTRELRRQRSGFGVLSRHTDGVAPSDFLTVEENLPMTYLIRDITYEWKYYPDLEKALQILREKVLGAM